MWKLVLAVGLLAPLGALADVVRVTCTNDVYDIDREKLSATSSSRPGAQGTVSLIGRNLIEVVWDDEANGTWEREMFGLHILAKMSTGLLDAPPPDDQDYVHKEKCLKREILP